MTRRPGFTLAEVLVAMMLLGVGILSLTTAAAAGRSALREAAAESRALLAGSSVLDSLVRLTAPQAGSSTIGPDSISWTVLALTAGIRVDLVVRFRDGTAARSLALTGVAAPPPPRLRHDR